MKRLWIAIALLGTGCATQAPDPLPTPMTAKSSYEISASELVVRDYSAADTNGGQEYGVYHDGWANWNQSAFTMSFGQALSHRLDEAFLPSGEGGDVELVIIRSDVSQLRKTSDNVVFVSLVTLGRDREYQCDLEFALETESSSRKHLVSFFPEPRKLVGDPFFYDDPRGSYIELVDECHEGLVGEVARVLSEET